MWGLNFGKQFKVFSGNHIHIYVIIYALFQYGHQQYTSKFVFVVNSDRGLNFSDVYYIIQRHLEEKNNGGLFLIISISFINQLINRNRF